MKNKFGWIIIRDTHRNRYTIYYNKIGIIKLHLYTLNKCKTVWLNESLLVVLLCAVVFLKILMHNDDISMYSQVPKILTDTHVPTCHIDRCQHFNFFPSVSYFFLKTKHSAYLEYPTPSPTSLPRSKHYPRVSMLLFACMFKLLLCYIGIAIKDTYCWFRHFQYLYKYQEPYGT
jgi:hypothetical protein